MIGEFCAIKHIPMQSANDRFTENDNQVYMVRLPTQVHQLLLKAQQRANNASSQADDIMIGEIRFDHSSQQGSLLVRRELDPNNKRWNLKMDLGANPAGTHEPILNMGIMTESRSSGVIKLQAMVDKKITCIAKNYSVDEETKAGLQKLDQAMTATIDAPSDPMQPVFI